jgi:hypothetical protein
MHLQIDKVAKALLFSFILSTGGSLYSEKILLKNGRAVYGIIAAQNEKEVKVISRLGEIVIATSQIAEISREKEPPIPQVTSSSSSQKVQSRKELFQLLLSHGRSDWRGGDLKVFADQSYDYWNSVGEIEKYLGNFVAKSRTPRAIGAAANWGIKILKVSRLVQIGFSVSHFTNSFSNEVVINDNKSVDSFKLCGNQIALVLATPTFQPVQLISRIEIGGNFAHLEYVSEIISLRKSHFYLSLLLANGVAFKLSPTVSLNVELGYFFAFSPYWEKMGINYLDEGFHGLKRPVIMEANASTLKPNLNGMHVNAGISFSINNFLRSKKNSRTRRAK